MRNLTRLDAGHTQISSEGLAKLVAKSEHKLKLYGKVGAWLYIVCYVFLMFTMMKVVDKRHSSSRSGGGSSRKKSSK